MLSCHFQLRNMFYCHNSIQHALCFGLTLKKFCRDVLKQHTTGSKEQRLSFEAYKMHVSRSAERCMTAFNELDVNRSGFITEDSLLCALKKMGMKPKQQDARRMIQLLDINCDHSITFHEFCRFAFMLPRIQLDSNAVSAWADSADFVNGIDFRPDMVQIRLYC
jgi:hypothetical protein